VMVLPTRLRKIDRKHFVYVTLLVIELKLDSALHWIIF
jgi:hypothetical protein